MLKYFLLFIFLLYLNNNIKAQCFASSGNPVGGSDNIGVMNKGIVRISSFYRYSSFNKYFEKNKKYAGDKGILNNANYNYIGLLSGYGLNEKWTLETEAGYYLNKTQNYIFDNFSLTAKGFSNAVISSKHKVFSNSDKRIELSFALGANIPFSREFKEENGVVLPIDIQPSTGSYGIVFQTFLIKENSFKGIRYFYSNRIEKYFENKQNYIFGNSYSNSLYLSKHFVFEKYILKDWTLIMQLRNQIKDPNFRKGTKVDASGNMIFYLIPQINLSINDSWNISLLCDVPVYQYYNNIQLANNFSLGLVLIKDFPNN